VTQVTAYLVDFDGLLLVSPLSPVVVLYMYARARAVTELQKARVTGDR